MTATTFVAEIDPNELMCRMLEAGSDGIVRPEGMEPGDLISRLDPEVRAPLEAMARAAFEYLGECLNGAEVIP